MGKTVHVPINRQYPQPTLENTADGGTSVLIIHEKNTPISPQRLYLNFKALTKKATGTAFRPHDFRRGAANWVYQASDFLGHDSIVTTSKYLGLDLGDYGTEYDNIVENMHLPEV